MCCTQYASKFGIAQQWPQAWKAQFSFQSQRRAMLKNVITMTYLHSFHMLARSCSKSSKLGFNSMWTKNFQMYKLDLEKAEEAEIKFPTSVGPFPAREFQKNICFIDYTKAFDCVDHNKLWKIPKDMGIPDHLTCLLRSLYADQEAMVRTGLGTMDWLQIGKGVQQGYTLSL